MERKDILQKTKGNAENVIADLRQRRQSRVEEFKVKIRKFSARDARQERVNKALFTGMIILELVMIGRMVEEIMRKENKFGWVPPAAMILLAAALLFSIGSMIWLRKSKIFRYAVLAVFIVPFAILAIFSRSVVYVFFIIPVLPALTLYYDKHCTLIYTSLIVLIDSIRLIFLAVSGAGIATEEINAWIILAIYAVSTHRVALLAKSFDHDAVYTLRDEQKMQSIMMEDILNTNESVQKGTNAVAEIMQQLQTSTSVVHNSLKEIAASTQLTAESVQEQTKMTQKIQEAISSTQQLSKDMVELAENSGNAVKGSLEGMRKIRQHSEEINRQNAEVFSSMQKLQEKTKEVQDIAGIIFSISSQTNLLALNASIESARAGEAGRGFAVVAEQIRQLSEQTRQSTENIAKIIEELNANAKAAAEMVDDSIEAAAEQNHMIDAAANSFGNISNDMNQLAEHIETVDKKIGNLVKANDTIVENISQLSATSEEVMASSQEAEESSEENSQNADQATLLLNEVLETVKLLEKYKNVRKQEE